MCKIRRLYLAVMAMALLVFMTLSGGMTAFAAGVNISFSDPSVAVGKEVTVKMKVKGSGGSTLGKVDVMLSYDSSMLEFVSGTSASGGAGSIRISESANSTDADSMEFSLKFHANQAGTAKISITTQEVYDTNNQLLNLENQGSSSVTISPLESASNVAELKELIISPGTLSPTFAPDIMEYTSSVDANAVKVAVSAIPKEEGKAKVTITGNDELVLGENKILCKVIAEDGATVKTYTITVTKGGTESDEQTEAVTDDLQVEIKGETYHIASSWNESSLPEGFEKQLYPYQGQEISIGKGLEKDLLLIYLINGSNEGAFYIYDDVSATFTPYVQLESTKKAIVILAPDPGVELPQGFIESKISIDNQTVEGWVWATETNHEYCIFYAMNWNGEKGFYRFDTKEKTIQRYFQDPALGVVSETGANPLSDTYQLLQKQYQRRFMLILVLIFVAVAMFGVTVYLLFKRNRNKAGYAKDFDDDLENQIPYSLDRNEMYDLTDEEFYQGTKDKTEPKSKIEDADEFSGIELDLSDMDEEPDELVVDIAEDDDFEIIDLDD